MIAAPIIAGTIYLRRLRRYDDYYHVWVVIGVYSVTTGVKLVLLKQSGYNNLVALGPGGIIPHFFTWFGLFFQISNPLAHWTFLFLFHPWCYLLWG